VAWIRVEPLGVEIEVMTDETIMGAACRQGYRWPSICNGQAECTTCYVRVVAGQANLGPMGAVEQRGMEMLLRSFPGAGGAIRLACQATLVGDVVVRKPGVRRIGLGPFDGSDDRGVHSI
jgi:2Fe-2S ferredoxin